MAGGAAPRQKGSRHERSLVHRFQDAGIAAQRIPMSGASAFANFSGFDLTVPMMGRDLNVECKHMGGGFKTLYKWLAHGQNDFLIVKADRSEDLAVVPLPLLIELIKAAEGKKK